MQKYEKPNLLISEGIAEGVFMASTGTVGPHYYNIKWSEPISLGEGRYQFSISANHDQNGSGGRWDNHGNTNVSFQLEFDVPVKFISTNGQQEQKSEGNSFSFNGVYLEDASSTFVSTIFEVQANTEPHIRSAGVTD